MSQERRVEPGQRFCLLAAWASPLLPLVVIAAFCVWRVGLEFEFWPRGRWPFILSVLVCIAGLLSGATGFCGVRKDRVLWIVLPAVLGLLLNLVVGCFMFVGWALSAGYRLAF
jgi:hypothetical protein